MKKQRVVIAKRMNCRMSSSSLRASVCPGLFNIQAIFWDDVLPYIARFAAVVRPYFYGHAPRAGASSAISAAHSGSAGGGDACPLGFDTPPEDGGAGEQNKCGGFMAEADFAQALTCYNYARRTARNALLQAKVRL